MSAKMLVFDIETSPNIAHIWSLWGEQHIGLAQLMESTQVMCFAAKWYGAPQKDMMFYSEFLHGQDAMVERAYELIDEADVVIHYNGKTFDMPHLRREFLLRQYSPPSPVQQIDLLQAVKANFKFPSNKLDYVSNALGVGSKVKHMGHELWVRCLNGDPEAWKLMEKYNRNDVKITEAVYDKILPWINNHPNMNVLNGTEDGCTNCGRADKLQRRGSGVASTKAYWRYQCMACGHWNRLIKSDVEQPKVVLRSA